MNNITLQPVPASPSSVIPNEVIKAHTVWLNAEKNIPEQSYMKGYKYRNNKARAAWKVFSNLCNTYGLGPVSTSHNIVSTIR